MNRLFFQKYRQWLSAARFLSLVFFCSSVYLQGVAIAETLTVTLAGTGSGTVNSIPSGAIACPGDCTEDFANGAPVTLMAVPDWKSLIVWSANCTIDGNGYCNVSMDTSKTVTATFDPNNQAALIITHPESEPKFSSLSAAYGYAITEGKNNFTLAAREYIFSENLILTNAIFFTLAGGKNSGYYTSVGFTTLSGYLEVQLGSVVIDSLIIL